MAGGVWLLVILSRYPAWLRSRNIA